MLLITALTLPSCKGDKRESAPAPQTLPSPVSSVRPLPALPPAPTAAIEPDQGSGSSSGSAVPPDAGARRNSTFPAEAPAIVVFRGSDADIPTTEMSLRIWSDGTVRFKCGRRGSLPRERVTSLVGAFVAAGWNTPQRNDSDTAERSCVTTTVQVTQAGVTHREISGCDGASTAIDGAVQLVQSVVGPDPCP
jgi:hypothetical protein